jgi:hypothetical protein
MAAVSWLGAGQPPSVRSAGPARLAWSAKLSAPTGPRALAGRPALRVVPGGYRAGSGSRAPTGDMSGRGATPRPNAISRRDAISRPGTTSHPSMTSRSTAATEPGCARSGSKKSPAGPRKRRRPSAALLVWRWSVVVVVVVGAGLVALATARGAFASDDATSSALTPCPARVVGTAAQDCSVAYVARPGDTIWSVAVRFDRGEDPRPLSDLLEAQIGGAVLQPGQRLMVPRSAALP